MTDNLYILSSVISMATGGKCFLVWIGMIHFFFHHQQFLPCRLICFSRVFVINFTMVSYSHPFWSDWRKHRLDKLFRDRWICGNFFWHFTSCFHQISVATLANSVRQSNGLNLNTATVNWNHSFNHFPHANTHFQQTTMKRITWVYNICKKTKTIKNNYWTEL